MLKKMNVKSDRANPRYSQAAHIAMRSTMFSAPLRGSGLAGMILLKDLELRKDTAEISPRGTVLATDGSTDGTHLYRHDYKLLVSADDLLKAQKSVNAEFNRRGETNIGLDILVVYILIQALARCDKNHSNNSILAYKNIEHFSNQSLIANAASLSLTMLHRAALNTAHNNSLSQSVPYLVFNDYSSLAIEHAIMGVNAGPFIICNYLGLRYNCRRCDNHDGCNCNLEIQLLFSADRYEHGEIINIIKTLQHGFKHVVTMFIKE